MKEYLQSYGLGMFLITGMGRVLRHIGVPYSVLVKYDNFKHQKVQQYLYKKYANLCEKTDDMPRQINRTAYVFWWQGEENAPELVRICIQSVRKNAGIPVVVLSEKNFQQYVTLPKHILEKFAAGKIGHAHFSDILRFNLLFQRGGVWLDATNFVTGSIPEELFQNTFWSDRRAFRNIYQWKWTSFLMVAQKNDYICGMMCDFYNQYWKDHSTVITYLVLDCWLTVLYNHNDIVRQAIDAMPSDVLDVFAIGRIIDKPHTVEQYEKAIKDSFAHKLSYKDSYPEIVDGALTTWGYIKQNENFDAC